MACLLILIFIYFFFVQAIKLSNRHQNVEGKPVVYIFITKQTSKPLYTCCNIQHTSCNKSHQHVCLVYEPKARILLESTVSILVQYDFSSLAYVLRPIWWMTIADFMESVSTILSGNVAHTCAKWFWRVSATWLNTDQNREFTIISVYLELWNEHRTEERNGEVQQLNSFVQHV